MKKLLLPVFLSALLFLGGCADDPGSASAPSAHPLDALPKEEVLVKEDNFEITAIEKDGLIKYSYTVTDNDGAVMETALCTEEPTVTKRGDNILGIRFTQENHRFNRYFDLSQKRISESFKDAFWDNGRVVAYQGYENGHVLIVRDIFDDDGFFEKTPVDCSSWQLTVYDVQETANSLSVRYYMGLDSSSNNGKGSATLKIPNNG